ncbi:MAG: hypothetical protein C4551_04375 [Bacillota bacterium]|nr:MAG: hypothetical protein C4551_04375 [Bacillota bacterium]
MPSDQETIAPCLATTGVGSLPHVSVDKAVADILSCCPEFPYWPQLPKRSRQEDMYRQFSSGLPGVEALPASGAEREAAVSPSWRRDDEAASRLERVYRDFLAVDAAGPEAALASGPGIPDRWATSPDDAPGLAALAEALGTRAVRGVKGQITGPISLGLAVSGPDGRALLYEDDLMDGVVRGLALKARWQEDFLSAVTGRPVLLSVDEPYLGTFGSAYFPYSPETVQAYLEILSATLRGLWGVHCCANTDWEFILGSPVRYLSFDAHAFGTRFVLYPEAVRSFLAAGKLLAWGVVPTDAETLAASDARGLARVLLDHFETLVARGVPETALTRQSMITPACGLAGLPLDEARRAMRVAQEVSRRVRSELGVPCDADRTGQEGEGPGARDGPGCQAPL